MIVDSRRTPTAAKFTRYWTTDQATDLKLFAQHAPGLRTAPSADYPKGTLPMGGVICAAWGDFGERAQAVEGGLDDQGRFAAVLVEGRGDGTDVLSVLTYRAPADDLKGGTLAARMAYRTGAQSAAEVHKDFDGDLLRQLQHWRATLRCEIVIGGDWNHELTAEGAEARDQWKAGGGLVTARGAD